MASRRRKASRRSTTSIERTDVRWVAVFAAVGGGMSGAEPTGLVAADVTIAAAFAGAVTLAGTRARRWSWLVIAGGSFALAGPEWVWKVAALAALVGAVAALVFDLRERVLGAVVIGVAVQVLLHLDDLGPHGTSAALTLALCVPVLVSGYRQGRSKERQIARWTAGVVAAAVVVAGAAYGTAALVAKSRLETGIDQATAGLEAARAGDDARAEELLADSLDSFASADGLLNGPLAWGARALPGLGHTAEATATMASSGHDLLAAASDAARTLDYEALAPRDGTVDLAEIARLSPTLAASRDQLLAAKEALGAATSDWLPAAVADPLDRFRHEVDAAIPDAELAVGAAGAAPWLLGADGARNYLVLFGQPAESRFGGGFVGTWAELSATGGSIDLVASGTIEELIDGDAGEARTLDGPIEYVERYERYFPWYNLQNVTASPHFPHVRDAITQLYPQAGGRGLSGAVYLDPAGTAALLALTGPVDVEGLEEPLTADNAEAFLTTEVYERFPTSAERDPILQQAIEEVFDALTSRDLPGPKTIADALSPAVRGGHLSLSVPNAEVEAFLESTGINGALPEVPEGGDFVAVKSANSAPNKLDSYLERQVSYEATLLPGQQRLEATLTVTFTNTAPASGLPQEVAGNRGLLRGDPGAAPAGTAFQYVSIYSPHKVQTATLDGSPFGLESQRELVRNVYSFPLRLAPGASATVVLQLTGTFGGEHYHLVVDHQPTVRPDRLDVVVRPPSGWAVPPEPTSTEGVTTGGEAHLSLTQTERVDVHVTADGKTPTSADPLP